MNREQRRAAKRAQRGHSKPPKVRTVWDTSINTISHAIEGAAIIPDEKRDRLILRELEALDAFVRGYARMQEWSDLVAMNNLAQTLAATFGVMREEVLKAAHLAEQDLTETAARYQNTGRWGLTGPAIEHLRAVINLHEQQRWQVTGKLYKEAARLTSARIENGHNVTDLEAILGAPLSERKAA